MARNGSGTYNRAVADYVNATTIDETAVNQEMDDVATALTNSIATNGESVITAAIPLNAQKITGLASGTVSGDAVHFGQIGTQIQAYDAQLDDLAALAVTDGNFIVADGVNWVVETGATVRTSLGLVIGTDVQAYDVELAALAGLTSAANKVPYFTGSGTAGVLDFLDEDNMASDSATATASQQSIKKYVDDNVATITLGTEQASTSGTTIDFTGIPAGTKRILVLFQGVSTSGTDDVLVQLGDAGGFEATGYVATSGQLRDSASSDAGSSTTGFIIRNPQASDILSGTMMLALADSANFGWVSDHTIKISTSAIASGGGNKELSAELTQIRITVTGADTFDAGAINIQYQS